MIRREDFIDALGMPDEGFTNAVDAALRQVKEGEARPVMKRKMTLTMLAAVLAVIALTGAARPTPSTITSAMRTLSPPGRSWRR